MVISDLIDNIRLLFVPEKKPFLQIKRITGFLPHDISLYKHAMMHKSAAYSAAEKASAASRKQWRKGYQANKRMERKLGTAPRKEDLIKQGKLISNERLEYLGDAVLGAIVADILYKHFEDKQEGFLTDLRSKLVCRSSLNDLSYKIGLNTLVKHTGAVSTAHNSFMGGNAFEAFIGAIYLDRGYSYCQRFIAGKVFKQYVDVDEVAKLQGNYKSNLIEWCQKYQYHFSFTQKESRDKKSNSPVFTTHLTIEGIPCGTGQGYSKKESDQDAAKRALVRIKKDRNLREGIKNAKEGVGKTEATAETQAVS